LCGIGTLSIANVSDVDNSLGFGSQITWSLGGREYLRIIRDLSAGWKSVGTDIDSLDPDVTTKVVSRGPRYQHSPIRQRLCEVAQIKSARDSFGSRRANFGTNVTNYEEGCRCLQIRTKQTIATMSGAIRRRFKSPEWVTPNMMSVTISANTNNPEPITNDSGKWDFDGSIYVLLNGVLGCQVNVTYLLRLRRLSNRELA